MSMTMTWFDSNSSRSKKKTFSCSLSLILSRCLSYCTKAVQLACWVNILLTYYILLQYCTGQVLIIVAYLILTCTTLQWAAAAMYWIWDYSAHVAAAPFFSHFVTSESHKTEMWIITELAAITTELHWNTYKIQWSKHENILQQNLRSFVVLVQ